MSKVFEVKKDIYFTGVVDEGLKVFDIIMETEFGTTYNSYLIKDEKTVLFDTVKANFKDEFLSNLSEVTDIAKIDYVVIHHTEPDHAGSLKYLLDINPNINIKKIRSLYNKDTSDEILTERYDYVVDAIDMVSSKIHLIETCEKKGLKIISSMGMGNKLDPTKIVVTDIHKTSTCPLAKVMRKELRDRGIKKLKVVYSTEQPIELKKKVMNGRKVTPGSVSFVPSVGGLIIASVIVNELLGQ